MTDEQLLATRSNGSLTFDQRVRKERLRSEISASKRAPLKKSTPVHCPTCGKRL